MRNQNRHQACAYHIKITSLRGLPHKYYCPNKSNYKNDLRANTSTHMQTGTRSHEYIDYTQLNLQPVSTDNKQRFEVEENNSAKRKTWQVCCFENRNVLTFDLKEF